MDYIKYGNETMVTLKRLEIDEKINGNIIPLPLYHELIDGYGRCNIVAVIILSEIIYWYRPKTETTSNGQIQLSAKYSGDLLQKSIPELADKFNFTYDQVEYAIDYLVKEKWIEKEIRQAVKMGKNRKVWNNVMYLSLNVFKLDKLLRQEKSQNETKQHLSTLFVQESDDVLSCDHTGNLAQKEGNFPVGLQESDDVISGRYTKTTTKTLEQQNKTKTTTTNKPELQPAGGGSSLILNSNKEQEQNKNQEAEVQVLKDYALSLDNDLVESKINSFAKPIASFNKLNFEQKKLAVAFCVYTGRSEFSFDNAYETWEQPIFQWSKFKITSDEIKSIVDIAKGEMNTRLNCNWNTCLKTPKSYDSRISGFGANRNVKVINKNNEKNCDTWKNIGTWKDD